VITNLVTDLTRNLISDTFMPSVTNGLIAYYDARNITGLVDGDPVAEWDDVSGNNYHVSQANTTLKPTYKGNYVLFDGVNDYLFRVVDGTDFINSTDITMVA